MIRDHLNKPISLISSASYQEDYQAAIQDPAAFWSSKAEQHIDWIKKWDSVRTGSFAEGNVRWFPGAQLNVCYNCLDRHLPEKADQIAFIWEGDDPTQTKSITYNTLYEEVCQFSNGLKRLDVKKGDRVCIYMPMILEATIAMLACARIGAVHSVVFAGFSPESLKKRVNDAKCTVIITADGNIRAGKQLPLKANVDEVVADCPSVKNIIIVAYTKQKIPLNEKDIWYHNLIAGQAKACAPETMEATDPLFILYTSGSTGTPKGVLHGQAGYLLHVTMTFRDVFNYQEDDIYWCTADIGWITGHSYLVYGPLSNGATTVLFGGVPSYPTMSRCWEIIDKYGVNIFYTAPTAIRAFKGAGDDLVKKTSRQSLKILGTVGEPINPDVWTWFYEVVGDKRCPVVDTWWQTELGGIMMTALPYATPLKPGAAAWPYFGAVFGIVDEQGNLLEGEATGNLVITQPWPGQLQTIYGDHARFMKTYFSRYPGMYETGDGVHRDKDGYYWITGRTDDVINVSGHRLDTAEIESALVSHPAVIEAAVVGCPHEIKGQGIYAFVTTAPDIHPDEALKAVLTQLVRKKISPIATPDHIQWTSDLPKTRSGKIMRRILRHIVNGETDKLGDLSTLANPAAVDHIIKGVS